MSEPVPNTFQAQDTVAAQEALHRVARKLSDQLGMLHRELASELNSLLGEAQEEPSSTQDTPPFVVFDCEASHQSEYRGWEVFAQHRMRLRYVLHEQFRLALSHAESNPNLIAPSDPATWAAQWTRKNVGDTLNRLCRGLRARHGEFARKIIPQIREIYGNVFTAEDLNRQYEAMILALIDEQARLEMAYRARLQSPTGTAIAQRQVESGAPVANWYRDAGGVWHISSQEDPGRSISVAHQVGLGYISVLLRSPGQSLDGVQVQTLMRERGVQAAPPKNAEDVTDSAGDGQLPTLATTGYDDFKTDKRALRDTLDRLTQVEEQLLVASDPVSVADLRCEQKKLKNYLEEVTGLGSRLRRNATDWTKANGTVRIGIIRAINAIEKSDETIAAFLRRNIQRTGSTFRYDGPTATWRFKE